MLLCSKLLSKLTPSTNFVRDTSLPRNIVPSSMSPTSSEFDPGDSIEYDSKTFEDSSGSCSPRESGMTSCSDAHDKTPQSRESFESRDSFDSADVNTEPRDQERKSREQEQVEREELKSRVRSRDFDEGLSIESSELVIVEKFPTPKFEKSKVDKNSDKVVEGKGKEGRLVKENEEKRDKSKAETSAKKERSGDSSEKRKEKGKTRREKSKEKRRKREKSGSRDEVGKSKVEETNEKLSESKEIEKNEEMVRHDSQSMLIRKCIENFMDLILEFFKWKIFDGEKAMESLTSDKLYHLKEMRSRVVEAGGDHVKSSCGSPSPAAKTYAAMCKLLVELSCFPMQERGTESGGSMKGQHVK